MCFGTPLLYDATKTVRHRDVMINHLLALRYMNPAADITLVQKREAGVARVDYELCECASCGCGCGRDRAMAAAVGVCTCHIMPWWTPLTDLRPPLCTRSVVNAALPTHAVRPTVQ